MERFARVVVGYHGCREDFAAALLLGRRPIADWKLSENKWDWLGRGIYFWEHSPERALRWAQVRYRGRRQRPGVIGAIIQLGNCFDLTNEAFAGVLEASFNELSRDFEAAGLALPMKFNGRRKTP